MHLENASLCQRFQLRSIAVHEGEFFGVGPAFDLVFAGDGVRFSGMLFLINQTDRATALGPERAAAFIMDFDSVWDVGGVAHVEGVVGAAEDVDEELAHQISLTAGRRKARKI